MKTARKLNFFRKSNLFRFFLRIKNLHKIKVSYESQSIMNVELSHEKIDNIFNEKAASTRVIFTKHGFN